MAKAKSPWRNRIVGYSEEEPDQLLANPSNWRIHPAAQQNALSGVLKEVGLVQNVVANRTTGHLVDGHLRVMLAMRENQPVVPVTWVELSEEEEHLILAALDPLAAMATADAGALDALLSSVQSGEAAVQQMLAELAEDAGLYQPQDDPQDAEPQVDRAEELRVKWGVESGQLWRLPSRTPGQEHRLICGDCTEAAVVERVMGGERARLVMTSPPYWVGKEYENEHTWGEVVDFIQRCSLTLADVCTHRIVINTGAPQAAHLTGERAHTRLLLDEWVKELREYGFLMRYVRIWAKRGGLAHTAPVSDCIDQHWEFVAVFYRPETYEGQRRLGEKWATDGIWDDFAGEMSSNGHVAAFPLEMPARNIKLYTDAGHTVYEPFSGSGTTLVAAENLSRQCRAVELAPGYVAVALERYATAFGIEPELIT